ncbi:Aste57867_12691 [Aphanomyces stellatus]|uniref:Aste57867_12691 protein n=1 Tax=Aphanomyces stellatus TaxID=120398 RepID=A0A485KX18_9STRA|nr:hypothetical protein As57867_012644 [Aphanomyces stellatus]VFT89541.1 Aste57867_12691 [Aphanomyces stellatus]
MATLVLVTGASRGFGRALALEFTKHVASSGQGDLHMHLWARNAAGLAATAVQVKAAWTSSHNHAIHVTETVVDLGDDQSYPKTMDAFLETVSSLPSLESVVIVHNAATLGQIGRSSEVASPKLIQEHMEVNVNSVLWFSKRFLQEFGQGANKSIPRVYFVDINSVAGITPFPAMGIYCVFKAARKMHFAVVAAEEPQVKTLGYAPGILDTDMNLDLRENPLTDPNLRDWFNNIRATDTYADLHVSASACIQHLFDPTCISGSQVDFSDLQK